LKLSTILYEYRVWGRIRRVDSSVSTDDKEVMIVLLMDDNDIQLIACAKRNDNFIFRSVSSSLLREIHGDSPQQTSLFFTSFLTWSTPPLIYTSDSHGIIRSHSVDGRVMWTHDSQLNQSLYGLARKKRVLTFHTNRDLFQTELPAKSRSPPKVSERTCTVSDDIVSTSFDHYCGSSCMSIHVLTANNRVITFDARENCTGAGELSVAHDNVSGSTARTSLSSLSVAPSYPHVYVGSDTELYCLNSSVSNGVPLSLAYSLSFAHLNPFPSKAYVSPRFVAFGDYAMILSSHIVSIWKIPSHRDRWLYTVIASAAVLLVILLYLQYYTYRKRKYRKKFTHSEAFKQRYSQFDDEVTFRMRDVQRMRRKIKHS